jgi:hypothetical protein
MKRPVAVEPPQLRRLAEIPAGMVFVDPFGEILRTVKCYGAGDAAPVVVEHLGRRHCGQYALWSAADVLKACAAPGSLAARTAGTGSPAVRRIARSAAAGRR